MQRTQIYLPKTQIDTLRKVAQKEKTTVSGVIRIFIEERLNHMNGQKRAYKKSETLFDALKRIKKLGEKGPKNLARNLDKYLYGDGGRQ